MDNLKCKYCHREVEKKRNRIDSRGIVCLKCKRWIYGEHKAKYHKFLLTLTN